MWYWNCCWQYTVVCSNGTFMQTSFMEKLWLVQDMNQNITENIFMSLIQKIAAMVKAEWSSAFRAACTLKMQHTFKITVLNNRGGFDCLVWWFFCFFFSLKTFLLPVQNFNVFFRPQSLGPLCLVPFVCLGANDHCKKTGCVESLLCFKIHLASNFWIVTYFMVLVACM